MARLSAVSSESPDTTAINLSSLLSRLEHSILSPEADPRLRHSSYERTRVGANLEYARTLLLRLEHSSSAIKIQSRKQAAQNNLLTQRALIKRLNERLYELEQLDDDGEDDVSAEGEDILGEDEGCAAPDPQPREQNGTDLPPESAEDLDKPLPPSSSTLRSRRAPQPPASDTATTTAISTSTHSSPPDPTAPLSQTRATETLLSHNRSEQETLTTSLLTLAQALKSSSQSFAASLESEKEVLTRTGEGLEKSGAGMEAAEKRMGMLRRMSEGRGLWGRLLMYVWIVGLMVLALVVVFITPKLRF
ncbi:hypothetical protein MMC16_005954 [Acarospora aff. strigata]|nr:hypothetical protein [Acarospora aff. strigata]